MKMMMVVVIVMTTMIMMMIRGWMDGWMIMYLDIVESLLIVGFHPVENTILDLNYISLIYHLVGNDVTGKYLAAL